jgi:hypothetical protein
VRLLVMQDQTACRAMRRLVDRQLPDLGLIRALNQRPDFSARIAKPGECTKVFGIAQDNGRPVDCFRLPSEGSAASCFAAIEADSRVRTVTEWFCIGVSAAAKGVVGFTSNVWPCFHSQDSPSWLGAMIWIDIGTSPGTMHGPSLLTTILHSRVCFVMCEAPWTTSFR